MVAELRSIETIDGESLTTYRPERVECFSLSIRLFVGPTGEASSDAFDLEVVTPQWLLENDSDEPLIGRHMLIVPTYNPNKISHFLSRCISRCHGDTWERVAELVSRIAYWEFEDYRTPAGQ
ncbi:hypothetical protein F0P96_19350 [Hymenobacter busanensis]|uniref:Uncharacterized protein n=1 Tax=Hymenobacter busanensis TaxID=2607656 RepID=A0A7L4ZXS4_9BACT|nr:immunity 8 family protein [Hymenobacter busanensis]KAA9325921.1 hypothetical protein F0P96_19350 [Hymenobacter busanensis]QHJ06240.1 hypothetical protein GUY19_02575 [Hymenobacter busanensis]